MRGKKSQKAEVSGCEGRILRCMMKGRNGGSGAYGTGVPCMQPRTLVDETSPLVIFNISSPSEFSCPIGMPLLYNLACSVLTTESKAFPLQLID